MMLEALQGVDSEYAAVIIKIITSYAYTVRH